MIVTPASLNSLVLSVQTLMLLGFQVHASMVVRAVYTATLYMKF